MSRSAISALAFLAAASVPLFAAKSSKPKEIVVVGSKIESASFQMPYVFGSDGSLILLKPAAGSEVARWNFESAWPKKAPMPLGLSVNGQRVSKSNVELDVARDGRIVGRLPGWVECVSESPEPTVVKATLPELGFSRATPITVTRRGQGHLLRMGEAVGRYGRCSVMVRLVPTKASGSPS